MTHNRLDAQIAFILEIDKLKSILRRTYLVSGERRENSAEHSWQVALMAMTLSEHAAEPVDAEHVVKMLLVHDIVEIDAGDVFVYDSAAMQDKPAKERAAAERIFALLPSEQEIRMHALWSEFEARRTPEAKFAAALDRLMPLLLNTHSTVSAWKENRVPLEQVLERNRHIADGSPALWRYAEQLIREAYAQPANAQRAAAFTK